MPADRPVIFGGRKKKPLIKPFLEQPTTSVSAALQPQTAQITQKANAQPAVNIQEKSRPRSTSFKSLLSTNDEKEFVNVIVLQEGASNFSQDDLQKYWIEYANTLDIKKIHLKNTLLNCKPRLEKNFSFEVNVYNPAQREEISENTTDIVNFLIPKLNNSSIKMTVCILEQDKNEMIYTSGEKFNYLKNKNPALEKLMDAFSLAIE